MPTNRFEPRPLTWHWLCVSVWAGRTYAGRPISSNLYNFRYTAAYGS